MPKNVRIRRKVGRISVFAAGYLDELSGMAGFSFMVNPF
jgi:hypothetical protein